MRKMGDWGGQEFSHQDPLPSRIKGETRLKKGRGRKRKGGVERYMEKNTGSHGSPSQAEVYAFCAVRSSMT